MRIGLVANELLGASRNGGIGTATAHLALFAAREGHDVHVIYTGHGAFDDRHPWTKRLRAAGVALTHLQWFEKQIYPHWLRESTAVFEHLRARNFDFVLFQDWLGCGYASMVARRTKLAFEHTRLAIWAHGPSAWVLEANRHLVRDEYLLGVLQLERTAFALADVLISPSHYLADWLRASVTPLSPDVQVIPLYLWSDPESDAAGRRDRALDAVKHLAFFGRLEDRKGIRVFVDAIGSSPLRDRDVDVSFLGKPASCDPEWIRARIAELNPALLPRLRFETDLDSDQAQRFLADHDCLAIIPSLSDNAPCVISECLRRDIPFLSTYAGGIPELVAPRDRERVLVQPDAKALADRLAAALDTPFAKAEATASEREVASGWRTFFEREAGLNRAERVKVPPHAVSGSGADIAVIVTHYERPHLVTQALASLTAQTDLDFEVVLVDDGSTSEGARSVLADLERQSWPFRFRLLRQPNRYLGAARNAGIASTTADRLVFLDDDNFAFPDLVEVLERSQRLSQADIVSCQTQFFYDPAGLPDPELLDGGRRWGFSGGSLDLGLSVNCFGDATAIYNRRVFDDAGLFHEWRGVGHEDWHLFVRAALAGFKILSVPVPLLWYRDVPGNMLNATDRYVNLSIIWDLYRNAVPPQLARFIDLSIHNDFVR